MRRFFIIAKRLIYYYQRAHVTPYTVICAKYLRYSNCKFSDVVETRNTRTHTYFYGTIVKFRNITNAKVSKTVRMYVYKVVTD